MNSPTDSILVFVPANDIACFITASMFRYIRADITYRVFNPNDRRTWPNPNTVKPGTWLYLLGTGFPNMPIHEAKAKQVIRLTGNESMSIAGLFWTTVFRIPLTLNLGLMSFERAWSNSVNAISTDWGLRFAVLELTHVAAKEGMVKALAAADAYFAQPAPAILADYIKRYDDKLADLTTVVADRSQYTIHVSEEVIEEFSLPKKWLGFVMRIVDTTGVEVDTSLLAHHIRMTLPHVDILVQHRKHQLSNNECHRYYCRAISNRVTTLLDWNILAGHPRAASGQITGAKGLCCDMKQMEDIDDMPMLETLSLA